MGYEGPIVQGRSGEEDSVVSVKKVAAWLVVAFLLFYVITAPESSADAVRSIFDALAEAARSFARFLQSLF